MRTISKYISFALMAFAVVACHTNEIDNPDNPDNPNPPQISDNVTFTASIKQTRVEYTHNGDKLDQRWKKDDVIYGFYGDGDGRKIALLVTDVDDKDGYATLKPLPLIGGDEFVAALKECIKKEELFSFGLIYTGKTGSIDTTEKELYKNDEIYVNMGNQSTGQIPACMESTSYEIDESNNGDTIINFKFENKCAILEIKGITGFKESTDLSEDGPTELDYINVSNIINVITYSYHNGAPGLGTDGTYKETGVKVLGSIYVDSNGNIVDYDGNSASVRIAVAPNTVENISVTAVLDGMEDPIGSSYNTDLVEGTCYIINAKPAVAKTEDGLYFSSVAGAFYRAKYLDGHRDLLKGKTNTVTLVKDVIDGLNEDVKPHTTPDSSPEIVINYPVTLDLNGCSLNLNYCEDDENWGTLNDRYYGGGFNVEGNTGELTIIDRSDGWGSINSYDDVPIITNSGTVNVQAGYLWNIDNPVICSTGTLNVTGGNLYSKNATTICLSGSGASGEISGGEISNESDSNETIQILNGAEYTISGGVICSEGDIPTIGCRSEDSDNLSKLTVTWPNDEPPTELSAGTGPIIYAKGATQDKAAPISTENSEDCHEAVVKIKGGYLLSSNVVFYINDEKEIINLDLNEFGGFYSNVYKIRKDGDAGGTAESLFYDLTSSGGAEIGGKFFRADSESGGSGFYMPIFEEYTGFLYKIIPCE